MIPNLSSMLGRKLSDQRWEDITKTETVCSAQVGMNGAEEDEENNSRYN